MRQCIFSLFSSYIIFVPEAYKWARKSERRSGVARGAGRRGAAGVIDGCVCGDIHHDALWHYDYYINGFISKTKTNAGKQVALYIRRCVDFPVRYLHESGINLRG